MGVRVVSSHVSSVTSGTSLCLKKHGFGGVEAAGEEIEGDVHCVFAALLGVEEGGHRVVIRDEVVGLAFVLQFHRRLHHAEIVADVQSAGGLDAG